MIDFVQFLTTNNVVGFFLLLIRIGSIFVFFPFFNTGTFSPVVKAAVPFYLTLVFYPLLPAPAFEITAASVMAAVITEILFVAAVGILLQMIFGALQFAGEQIAFVMGFTMANTVDPATQVSSPIISQFLNLLALMIFLSFDGHHLLLSFMGRSLEVLPVGSFVITENYILIALEGMKELFAIGFSVAFPILALSLLSDIIFGMIMKTMPSFNLLVIGFPAKIAVAFIVFIAVLGSMMVVFKQTFLEVFNRLVGI